MSGVMEEIIERVRRETSIDVAKKIITEDIFSLEKISALCELPLEKVQELAAESSDSD